MYSQSTYSPNGANYITFYSLFSFKFLFNEDWGEHLDTSAETTLYLFVCM